MLQQVGPQKSGSKNNEDKNVTASWDISFQIKFADIFCSSNKIREIDKAWGNGVAEFTVAIKEFKTLNMI